MRIVFPSRNRINSVLIAMSVATTGVGLCLAQTSGIKPSTASAKEASIRESYGKLPLSFEANRGQTDKRIKFLARGRGYGLFLNGQEAVLALRISKPAATEEIVRMELRGASAGSQPTGLDALPGTVNYFVGRDASKWQTGIPTYSRVRFPQVYPGVDVVYYGNQEQLEYDFVVAPNADPKAIRLHFTGASKLNLEANGDLSIKAKTAKIAFNKPTVYQEVDGRRKAIAGQFTLLAKNDVGFTLGSYYHDRPLVIDPVLVYSTYLGGTTADSANAVAADATGNAYVAGYAGSTNFKATYKAFQGKSNGGGGDAFISKLNPTGTALVYSTYLGGSGLDDAIAIAVDASGDAYVTGYTQSQDFPITPGAFQVVNNFHAVPAFNGGGNAFIAKLNSTGTALIYSTYLGGSGYLVSFPGENGGEQGNGIAVDSFGNAYVAGSTYSTDFPVTEGAFHTKNNDAIGNSAGFITKLNPTGTALVYSTYLGGSNIDSVQGIAVDSTGHAYVGGSTGSTDFPITADPLEPTPGPGFITKLNPTGTAEIYSTYFDGAVAGIAVDGSGDAYVTGGAFGHGPAVTPGAFTNGNGPPFVSKLNPAGSALVYSANLGGGFGTAIAIDSSENAYVTGGNSYGGLATTPGAFQVGDNFSRNSFVSKLNSKGSTLLYSTYLGGSGSDGNVDTAAAIAVDPSGNAYVVGSAASHDFPVTPGALEIFNPLASGFVSFMCCTGQLTGFVSKFALASPTPTNVSTIALSAPGVVSGGNNYDFIGVEQTIGTPVTFTATLSGSGAVPTGNVYFSLNGVPVETVPLNGGTATYTNSTLNFGTTTVQAIYGGNADYSVSNTSLTDSVIPATPSFSPPGGKYTGSVAVTMTTSPDSTIYYTLDGSAPGAGSLVYSTPVTLTAPGTMLRAIAGPNGQGATAVTQTYTFYYVIQQTPAPIISPAPGSYPVGQLITITDAIPTATIRYTTDGTTPTTKSNFYSKPFPLTGTETIQAIAISTGDAESNVTVAAFSN